MVADYGPVIFTAPAQKMIIMPLGPVKPENSTPAEATPPQSTATGAEPASAPSAAGPEQPPTEEKKTKTAANTTTTTTTKEASPFKDAVTQIERIKETLRTALTECGTVLSAIKFAEREQKATEKEVEGVRTTVRALQKVEI